MHPLSAQAPRTVVESAVPPTSTQLPATIKSENVRSVILDPKDDVLVLDDIKVGMGKSANKHDLGLIGSERQKTEKWTFGNLDVLSPGRSVTGRLLNGRLVTGRL